MDKQIDAQSVPMQVGKKPSFSKGYSTTHMPIPAGEENHLVDKKALGERSHISKNFKRRTPGTVACN